MKDKKYTTVIFFLVISSLIIGYLFLKNNEAGMGADMTSVGNDITSVGGDITSTGVGNIGSPEKLEDLIELLMPEEEVVKILEKDSRDYLEELPRVESYYTEKPFYEFFMFLSIKNNNVLECEKIADTSEKNLCKTLFNLKDNKKDFTDVYLKYEKDVKYANSLYEIYNNINNEKCLTSNIMLYLGCKKIHNKSADIRDIFIKYSILEYSNLSISKKSYKILSKIWGFDDGFNYVVEKTLFNE